jgi:hypothetical protein
MKNTCLLLFVLATAFTAIAQLTGEARQSSITAPLNLNAAPADAEKEPSGLASKVLKKGTGEKKPTLESVVTVHYSGWTTDGKLFDSSLERGTPATFPLKGVIFGWQEGVQLMKAGEKRRLWIPAALAYGKNPPTGAPKGTLVFDVELISFRADTQSPSNVVSPPAAAVNSDTVLGSNQLDQKAEEKFRADYSAAVDELESTYPAVLDDESEFTALLDEKLAAARYRQDPKLANPRYILELAANVAKLLSKPSALQPPQPPAVNNPSPDFDIQDYLRKAQAGQAGQNPRDVTAARSGDRDAMARIAHRNQTNQINQAAAEGSISSSEKLRLLSDAENQRMMRQQALEQERLMSQQSEDMRRELQRIRQQQQDMILQQQRMETQRRWELEQRNRMNMQQKSRLPK